MENLTDRVLTQEQQEQFSTVHDLISGAIQETCEGCSAAKFAPERIARAVAVTGRLSLEVGTETAARFAACPGLFAKMCHLPSAAGQKTPATLVPKTYAVKLGPHEKYVSLDFDYPSSDSSSSE